MRRLLFTGACLTAFLAGILRAQDDTPEVRTLKLEGVEHVDRYDLEKSISTRASKCRSIILEIFCLFSHSPTFVDRYYFDEDEFRRDVLRIRLYYWKRGYRGTTVDTAVRRTGVNQVAVTFKVDEGPPTIVQHLTIDYDTALISERTRNRLTLLHAGDPLDLVLLDSMRVSFQNELWDQGFGDAVVDTSVVVDTSMHTADVSLTLTPNRRTTIGRITVAGNQKVEVSTILRSLSFQTGDLYRQSTVLESQRNLYESNLFKLATIYVPPQHDTVKNVNIDVTEAPLHEARIGPGFTNIEFLQLQSHYTVYNLFGGARRLDLDALVGNLFAKSLAGLNQVTSELPDTLREPFLQPTYSLSVDFKQPSFLRRANNSAGIGAFAHRTINPGVFVDRGYGGQITFTHLLRPRAPLSLNYRYELNRVRASDTYFCVNYGVCDTLTIQSLRSRLALSPATFTGFIDRSDRPFSPTKGYVGRFDFEYASTATGSNYKYNRYFADAAIYTHKSGTQLVLSAHGRFGFVQSTDDDDVLHPRKRFYAGGANSVRGYAENQLGPRVLTIEADTLVRVARSVN
ncbi:MAG TPA: BamA/TamA family outer membrane protein, partial [Gemmatimonadaceae bacterium]